MHGTKLRHGRFFRVRRPSRMHSAPIPGRCLHRKRHGETLWDERLARVWCLQLCAAELVLSASKRALEWTRCTVERGDRKAHQRAQVIFFLPPFDLLRSQVHGHMLTDFPNERGGTPPPSGHGAPYVFRVLLLSAEKRKGYNTTTCN